MHRPSFERLSLSVVTVSRAVWFPPAGNGDVTTAPKPLLKLPVLFFGVRRLVKAAPFSLYKNHLYFSFSMLPTTALAEDGD